MKKEDIPQDKSGLVNFTRELCYAKNEDGKYDTSLSKGWDVKVAALDNAWTDINDRVEKARAAVERGEKSPIFYFMEKNIMDLSLLSSYVSFFSFKVKRHFQPSVFEKLSTKTLQRYADVFNIELEELKNPFKKLDEK